MENKDLFTDEKDKMLLTAFAWWEKKRIVYNMVLLVTGGITLFMLQGFDPLMLIGVLIYGVFANVFYCLGFFIEMASHHYFKSDRDFTSTRVTIFWIGLIFSVFITLFMGSLLSLPVPY
jgi:hypothetical protein